MQVIDRLHRTLISQGWAFLVPYFALYVLFWATGWPVVVLTGIYTALHLFYLGVVSWYMVRHRRQIEWQSVVFWSVAAWVLFWPGAYLEYPTDVWEHVRRIFRWRYMGAVADHDTCSKQAYFLSWTLVSWLAPSNSRAGLDALSTAWQLLWLYQVYLVMRRLGADRQLARLQVLAYALLVGTGVFGIRYYALSSTPLAQVIYLRGLIWLLDFVDGKRRAWPGLLLIVPMLAYNHLQELLFLLVEAGAVGAFAFWRGRSLESRRRLLRVFWIVLATSLAFGAWVRFLHPAWFGPTGTGLISELGTFKLWVRSPFLETWGIAGLLGIWGSYAVRDRYPVLPWLTGAPIFLLFFPPTAIALAFVFPSAGTAYRLLFAFPATIALVFYGYAVTFRTNSKSNRVPLAPLAAALVVLAALPWYPFRGRLFFQLYRPAAYRTLEWGDPMVSWLRANARVLPDCWWIGDDLSRYLALAYLGTTIEKDPRPEPTYLLRDFSTTDSITDFAKTKMVCGVLMIPEEKIPTYSPSLIARMSGHWKDDWGSVHQMIPHGFERAAEGLSGLGWTRHLVGDHHVVFLPPEAKP